LRKSFTVIGFVLVVLGLYGVATITNLVRAYISKPDTPNGGILILSRFVHISYTAVLGIAGVAIFIVLVGIIVMFVGTRKPTPSFDQLKPQSFSINSRRQT
jgi:flagellar biosynthesis protein FlhB